MYYLVITNLGVEKCIDKNESDIYKNYKYYDCKQSVSFISGDFKSRNIKIRCIENPQRLINAKVYCD
jgi:hypothetical protein